MELDVFSTLEREDKYFQGFEDKSKAQLSTAGKSIRECWIRIWRENWFFLILLSLTSASIILLVDVVSSKLVDCMHSAFHSPFSSFFAHR
jgi:hypothetical protein